MNIPFITHESDPIAKHAHAMIAATANIEETEIANARQSLAEALDRAKINAAIERETAIAKTRADADAVRRQSFVAHSIAAGVGAVLGPWVYSRIQQLVVKETRAANDAVRHHPVATVAVATGVAVLVGIFFSRHKKTATGPGN